MNSMPASIFGIFALEGILVKLDADFGWWLNQEYSSLQLVASPFSGINS